jgi:hypothetical protein
LVTLITLPSLRTSWDIALTWVARLRPDGKPGQKKQEDGNPFHELFVYLKIFEFLPYCHPWAQQIIGLLRGLKLHRG